MVIGKIKMEGVGRVEEETWQGEYLEGEEGQRIWHFCVN